MTRLYCDGPLLLRAVAAAAGNLERHVDEVDALNVFPVPDGDTGSNMLATMKAALAEAERVPVGLRDLPTVAAALSRGALSGARGNSGVILSQIIRGMTHGAEARERASGVDLAEGLRRGSEVAYTSVLTPVEGTILTVIRDVAEAAEAAAGRRPHVESVLAQAVEAAAGSVARTPSLLRVLEEAGVVDSGGQGLFRLLEGALQVGRGRASTTNGHAPAVGRATAVRATESAPADAAPARRPGGGPMASPGPVGYGYEAEFMLYSSGEDLDIEALREQLQAIGESVIVAGDARAARVHVHGLRPDLAIGVGLRAGRLSAIEISDLDSQAAGHAVGEPDEPAAAQRRDGPALVAFASGHGLAAVFHGLGAAVVEPRHGDRPSVGEIADAIEAARARHVVILPNDRDARLAAGQAAAMADGVEVAVVPTRDAAEGIAAALAFDAAAPLADTIARMEAEARDITSIRVTVAARDSVIDGVEVRRGQAIALDADRRLLAVADDLLDAAVRALEGLATPELVTVYHGAGVAPSVARELADRLRGEVGVGEVEVVEGGQRHDRLLLAVE